MNNQRRKKINEVKSLLKMSGEMLDKILNEEQDYFDNMPENLQGSMRGEDSEAAIESLEESIDAIGEAIGSLEEIVWTED